MQHEVRRLRLSSRFFLIEQHSRLPSAWGRHAQPESRLCTDNRFVHELCAILKLNAPHPAGLSTPAER